MLHPARSGELQEGARGMKVDPAVEEPLYFVEWIIVEARARQVVQAQRAQAVLKAEQCAITTRTTVGQGQADHIVQQPARRGQHRVNYFVEKCGGEKTAAIRPR
jgi:hypothetical protein